MTAVAANSARTLSTSPHLDSFRRSSRIRVPVGPYPAYIGRRRKSLRLNLGKFVRTGRMY